MFNQNCCRPNRNNCCQRQVSEAVVEPTITKCVQKDFYHEVPQACYFMIEKAMYEKIEIV